MLDLDNPDARGPQLYKVVLDVLKENKLISRITKEVKVINSGELKKAIKIKGLKISKTASEEVKKSGGEVS